MKHRFLSLLLVLTMVLSMWTVPVSAQTEAENITSTAETCRCGCGQSLDAIHWTIWDPNTKGVPSSGHYYLADDYVQTKQQSIMSGDRVVLDLRGHSITTKDYSRLLLVYGRVYIMDTVGGGGGGCIRVYGTSSYKKADITIQNASIRDGSVTGTSAGGGDLSIGYGTYNISDCYIASSDETGTTFHRLENRITNVSLRPSAAGLYYTGSFGCDESIAAGIASYGVAVSTVNMPGKDFMTDEDTLYTTFDASTLVNGAQKTGVLLSGIMKEDRSAELNDAYGKMSIFATSYLIMQDGTVILSDTDSHGDDVAYSLYDITNNIDRLITAEPLSYRKFTNPMRDFYNKWKELGMGSWEFNKINPPADDGVIDVLMIGSSFCYYYVEELCGLAEAAGIPMRVCNVYYSGCPLEKHYNWWINGESNYQFFDTTYAGGRKQTNNVSLEWCLAQGEWDVISLQQSTSATVNDPNHLETTRLYYTTLLNYLMEQFPAAQMCWHQPWTYQIGYDRDGVQITTPEQQQEREDIIKAYCVAICEEFDIQRINTGEAWQIVRNEYGYDELCARLGKGTNHVGDYYHDGDIGGGQYLNACVWFEIITGVSPVGNTYAPTYTYGGETFELDSDITFAQLQEAAHKAVEQLRAQEAAAEEA